MMSAVDTKRGQWLSSARPSTVPIVPVGSVAMSAPDVDGVERRRSDVEVLTVSPTWIDEGGALLARSVLATHPVWVAVCIRYQL